MKQKVLFIAFLFFTGIMVQAKTKSDTLSYKFATTTSATANMTGNATICPGNTAVLTITGTPDCTVKIHNTDNPDIMTYFYVMISASGSATFTTPILQGNTTFVLEEVTEFATGNTTVINGVSVTITVVPNGCATLTPATNFGTDILQVFCTPGECRTLTATASPIPSTSNYTVSSIPYCPRTYPAGGFIEINIPNVDDKWSEVIALPFNFSFYGQTYNQCSIGTNGVLSFNPQTPGGFCDWPDTNVTLGGGNTTFNQKNAIFGVYQDTDFRTSGPAASPADRSVSYKIEGTYPCRKLIINFYHLGHWNCNQTVGLQTSQIILYEVSNIIEVFVERRTPCTAAWAGSGVIGIINASGSSALVPPGRDTGAWSAFNEAWRFIPTGSDLPFTFEWLENNNTIATSLTTTVCPTASTTYTAKAVYTLDNGNTITVTSPELNLQLAENEALPPSDLTVCYDPSENYVVDLTQNNAIMLANTNPFDYEIAYFTSLADAQNLANPISNPSSYAFTHDQTIYVGYNNVSYDCIYTGSFQLTILSPVSAPTGISPQEFAQGQTLDDLIVNGQNVNWYDAPQDGNLLPGTTVLQDNTTYYATQTIDSCESKVEMASPQSSRLAILVQLSLGTPTFDSNAFRFYPNPATTSITLSSSLDSVKLDIYNALTQKVDSHLLEKGNNTINLTNFSSGIYLFQLQAEGKIKTYKIVKN